MDNLKFKIKNTETSVPIQVIVWVIIILIVLILWVSNIVPIGTAYYWLLERWRELKI